MSGITMYDTVQNDQFPPGAQAYAAYVDGAIGDQPNYTVTTEAELQSGQLNLGKNALTVIAVPPGTAHHVAFGCDNNIDRQLPARLRIAIYDTLWHVQQNIVDGAKGLLVVPFPNPARTGVISVLRQDAGTLPVGYVVY